MHILCNIWQIAKFLLNFIGILIIGTKLSEFHKKLNKILLCKTQRITILFLYLCIHYKKWNRIHHSIINLRAIHPTPIKCKKTAGNAIAHSRKFPTNCVYISLSASVPTQTHTHANTQCHWRSGKPEKQRQPGSA